MSDHDRARGEPSLGRKAAWFVGALLLSLVLYAAATLVWGVLAAYAAPLVNLQNASRFVFLLRLANAGIWLLASVALGAVVLRAVGRWTAPSNVWLAVAIPQALFAVAALFFYASTATAQGSAWIADYVWGPTLSAVLFTMGAYIGARAGRLQRSKRESEVLSN